MDAKELVGTWRLVSLEMRDATGYLAYTADGYMQVVITSANRIPFAAADMLGGSAAEQAGSASTCIAYAGSYALQEGKVVHHVLVSLFPNWVGSTQERFLEFDGDRLSLCTAPMRVGGREGRGYLVWERAVPRHTS